MKSTLVAQPETVSPPEQGAFARGDLEDAKRARAAIPKARAAARASSIILLGTSFKTSSLAFREALAVRLSRESSRLPRLSGVKEYAQLRHLQQNRDSHRHRLGEHGRARAARVAVQNARDEAELGLRPQGRGRHSPSLPRGLRARLDGARRGADTLPGQGRRRGREDVEVFSGQPLGSLRRLRERGQARKGDPQAAGRVGELDGPALRPWDALSSPTECPPHRHRKDHEAGRQPARRREALRRDEEGVAPILLARHARLARGPERSPRGATS